MVTRIVILEVCQEFSWTLPVLYSVKANSAAASGSEKSMRPEFHGAPLWR